METIIRAHPLVNEKSKQLCVGYDDAEAIVRSQKDPASVAAIKEVDDAKARERAKARAMNTDMAKRMGLTVEQATALVAALVADPPLETWLMRRVNLSRANGAPPADDEHFANA